MVYYNCKTDTINPKSIGICLGLADRILDKDKEYGIIAKPQIFNVAFMKIFV